MLNAKKIRKALTDCAFNPRASGPLKVLAEVGNPDYWVRRALEEIAASEDKSIRPMSKLRAAKLQRAVQCLALALAHAAEEVSTEEGSGSEDTG